MWVVCIKPFVLGIAGDSGSGKGTYCEAISGVFGSSGVSILSGDNYHLWDREKAVWRIMTHLNPMANDLEKFSHDLLSLISGNSIESRRYDHETGQMAECSILEPSEIILVEGLHALYLPNMWEQYDFKVYLETDEELRRYFKIRRDVLERGHRLDEVLSSLSRRESDAIDFIKPQRKNADLVLSLQLLESFREDDEGLQSVPLKIVAEYSGDFDFSLLANGLSNNRGLSVAVGLANDGEGASIGVTGVINDDICSRIATELYTPSLNAMGYIPSWRDGPSGLMQLLTLALISPRLESIIQKNRGK